MSDTCLNKYKKGETLFKNSQTGDKSLTLTSLPTDLMKCHFYPCDFV